MKPTIDSWQSLRRQLASLSANGKADVRKDLLRRAETDIDDVEAEALLTTWELWARPNQLPPAGEWTYWAIIAGRGFGKTRSGGEWVRDSAMSRRFQLVNLIGATADDARDIMIEGESGLLAITGRYERPEYRPSKRCLDWPNGCRSLIFTADEPERLRGKQHQRLWADEVAAWRYQEAWDQAMLGLRLGPDPRAVVTTTPKPKPIVRDLLARPRVVISKGTTYENRANLAPAFFDEIIRKYEGTRLGRQELEAEILLDEGLAYRVEHGVHVVPAVAIPRWWQRFEAMDWGSTNPTAWLAFAVDHDSNIVVFDAYYSPGLVSEHAAAVLAKRLVWYPEDEQGERDPAVCYAPADIHTRHGFVDPKGREITVETEFAAFGISFGMAQMDRRAGYIRVAELLARRPERVFPNWHPLRGQPDAPGLYVFDTVALEPLVEQLRDALLEDTESPLSRFPGEAVDQAWESAHGHAHAALRYGLMSRPEPSERPKPWEPDPRRRMFARIAEAEREQDEFVDEYGYEPEGMFG